jgi:hypothetical protein
LAVLVYGDKYGPLPASGEAVCPVLGINRGFRVKRGKGCRGQEDTCEPEGFGGYQFYMYYIHKAALPI